MWHVAKGFLTCQSKCGRDPYLKHQCMYAVLLSSTHTCTPSIALCLCGFCTIFWNVIVVYYLSIILSMSFQGVLILLVLNGLVMLCCCIRFGNKHLVIGNEPRELMESTSGCCHTAYRRKSIAKLSNIADFHTERSSTQIGNVYAVHLVIRMKNQSEYRLIQNGEQHKINEKCAKIQRWWIQSNLSREFNVQFKFQHNLLYHSLDGVGLMDLNSANQSAAQQRDHENLNEGRDETDYI